MTDTAICLARLTGHEIARQNSRINFVSPRGSLVCILREDIAERAIAQGATHILWIDSDMTFPWDGLQRLLSHGKPVVGCNYPTRCAPASPTAMRGRGRPLFESGKSGLEEVEALGFGFVLTETAVFKTMPKPWFSVGWDETAQVYIGEDFNFCLKAPCPVMVDHDLSREIGHVGNYEFTHADTLEAAAWPN